MLNSKQKRNVIENAIKEMTDTEIETLTAAMAIAAAEGAAPALMTGRVRLIRVAQSYISGIPAGVDLKRSLDEVIANAS